jgi:anti-sigma regulatory factor (Ser/Thr protein kinase)
MSASLTESKAEAPYAELRLPPDVSAPACARRTVHDLLSSLPPSVQARLSLVASELVTNVLRHCTADEPVATLTVALSPDCVTLAVADAGDGFDPMAGHDSVGGWGLRVLDAVADRWWIEREGGTKVVCEIDR